MLPRRPGACGGGFSRVWDPTDCSLPGSSVHGDFPGKNTGVGCHFLLQAIFPTQGSNLHLPRWQVDSLPLNYQGSPYFFIQFCKFNCFPEYGSLTGFSSERCLLAFSATYKTQDATRKENHFIALLRAGSLGPEIVLGLTLFVQDRKSVV